MFDDTIADWQSLTRLYGEMGDGELLELDAQAADLTNVAQQVLRDEMKKRGLSRPRPADNAPKPLESTVPPIWEYGAESRTAGAEQGDQPHEYTWKTLLCECSDLEHATPIRMALLQAGIESWIEGQGYRVAAEASYPRILVAADQLELAREVASRPIPQAIVEQSRMPPEEYNPPVCPRCGAEDPLLEGVDPVNSWLCESCDHQWTDAVEEKTIPN